MTTVTVVVGAGSVGQAIARRVSAGKHVADFFANLLRED
jgi:predicted dinucleotide-binding enzyme